jgi:hypothetical protein
LAFLKYPSTSDNAMVVASLLKWYGFGLVHPMHKPTARRNGKGCIVFPQGHTPLT